MRNILHFFVVAYLFFSCSADYTPKPRGLLRIDIPKAQYQNIDNKEIPFAFEISHLATIEIPDTDNLNGWLNICYPSLHAKVYCNHHHITCNTLTTNEKDCRKLVLRATKNANSIMEQRYEAPEKKVFATLFSIEGESASPIQFIITDSVSRFFRGALYYLGYPNPDSIAPINEYLTNDMVKFIQSFSWK